MHNLFIYKLFIECLLCARYSIRLRGDHSEQDILSAIQASFLQERQEGTKAITPQNTWKEGSTEIPMQEETNLLLRPET